MDSMILGRYIPGDSIIHRLDPRSKLLAMILLILIVFWANNPLTNLVPVSYTHLKMNEIFICTSPMTTCQG